MSNQAYITGDLQIRSLTGALTATSGVVSSLPLGTANGIATLGSDGKVPSSQLPTMGSSYKGTWDASTNTPYIHDGTGTGGDYYLVSVGGTQNLGSGSQTFLAGNTVIYSGTIWQKAGGGSGTVTSVGFTAPSAFTVTGSPITSSGTIALTGAGSNLQYIKGDGTLATLNTTAVVEAANLYYTDARSRGALSFVAGSGAYNSTTGVLTIPTNTNQLTNGAGFITSSALSSYLPLSGGTLTGALYDTSASFSGNIELGSASNTAGIYNLYKTLNNYLYVGVDNNIGSIFGNGAYAANFYTTGNYPIAFQVNGAARLNILGNGNIGANTSSPNSQLEIYGATGNALTDGLRISRNTLQTSQYGVINYTAGILNLTGVDTSSGGAGRLNASNGTTTNEILRWLYSGAIQFTGASTTTNAQAEFDNDNSFLSFYPSLSGSVNKGIRFFYNGGSGEAMRVTNTGSLLVGSTTNLGLGKVEITGDLYVSGGAVYAGGVTYSSTQTFNGLAIFNSVVSLNNRTRVASSQPIEFLGSSSAYDVVFTNSGSRLLIASGSGSVDYASQVKIGQGYGFMMQGSASAYDVSFYNLGLTIDSVAVTGGLNLQTTTAPFVPPRMTTTQRDTLAARGTSVCPAGSIIFNTTINILQGYNGSAWSNLW